MSKMKTNLIKITMGILLIILFCITFLFVDKINENKLLKEENNYLSEVLESNEDLISLVVIVEDNAYSISAKENSNLLSILISSPYFDEDDFITYNQENYYFKNNMTDVIGAPDEAYTTDEWGTFFTFGLEQVLLKKGMIVVRYEYGKHPWAN